MKLALQSLGDASCVQIRNHLRSVRAHPGHFVNLSQLKAETCPPQPISLWSRRQAVIVGSKPLDISSPENNLRPSACTVLGKICIRERCLFNNFYLKKDSQIEWRSLAQALD